MARLVWRVVSGVAVLLGVVVVSSALAAGTGGVGNETDNVWQSIAGGEHHTLTTSQSQGEGEFGPTLFGP